MRKVGGTYFKKDKTLAKRLLELYSSMSKKRITASLW